jgi:hypothetical protein
MIANVQGIHFRKVFTEINENLENRYLIRYIEYVWSFLNSWVVTFQLFAVPNQAIFSLSVHYEGTFSNFVR